MPPLSASLAAAPGLQGPAQILAPAHVLPGVDMPISRGPARLPVLHRVAVERLRHIEGHSRKRVDWLVEKILAEGVWTKPIALDEEHDLVLDGQHRMESAKRLGLKWVPAVRYVYAELDVWSLRPKHSFDWRQVAERALAGKPYPYKTVKHRFPDGGLPEIAIPLDALRA